MKVGIKWIDEAADRLVQLADTVWEYAEVGLREYRSAELLSGFLEEEGFSVVRGVGGMPTAFIATYGEGRPVIGFLGEYDALPGMSQKAVPHREPVREGAPGHGCGHNLLGVGSLAAAVAVKREMQASGLAGTVRYYGCPAEETLVGKVFMAREGVFDDLDAALTWHPMQLNTVWMSSSLAMNSVRFVFHGRAAHAAAAPHTGVSALDAVELMNVGVNFLREHIVQDARIHYVVTRGGGEPNVVPPVAESWYYVRAPERSQVDAIYERVVRIAQGAALMTGAELEIKFQVGCYEFLPNEVISRLLEENLEKVGAPVYSEEEMRFAQEIESTFEPGQKLSVMRAMNAPDRVVEFTLHNEVIPPFDKGKVLPGSTDVGDVSWITPTGQITTACWVVGTPSHSWQAVVASRTGIGHKGMFIAAKTLALTAHDLMTKPELLASARDAFKKDTGGRRYASAVPAEVNPPLNQLAEH